MYFHTLPLNIIDVPADERHTSGKRLLTDITLIVLHDTGSKPGEDYHNTIRWLTTHPASDVSSHRFIAPNGQIYKLAPDDEICHHVGFSRMGTNSNLNLESLGIEIFKRPEDHYTIPQLQSTARQCVEWYGIHGPLAIVDHSWIDTQGKVDPRMFPRKEFNELFFFHLRNNMIGSM